METIKNIAQWSPPLFWACVGSAITIVVLLISLSSFIVKFIKSRGGGKK